MKNFSLILSLILSSVSVAAIAYGAPACDKEQILTVQGCLSTQNGTCAIAGGDLGVLFNGMCLADISDSYVVSANINFTIHSPYVSRTTILGGVLPRESELSGSYGVVTLAKGSTQTSISQIQFKQKPANENGQITINNGTQSELSGNIQLSKSTIQAIENIYGVDARVTSIGIWVDQDLYAVDTSINAPTYASTIVQALVFLYINGQSQPVSILL